MEADLPVREVAHKSGIERLPIFSAYSNVDDGKQFIVKYTADRCVSRQGCQI